MTTPARERAAAVLGVPVAATAGEAAGAFLATLPRHEFVPPGDAVAAFNALADVSVPPDPDGETEPGLSVAERVEDFARQFWSLAPAERAAEWMALSRQARDAAASRLLALQPGLEVATHALSDPDAEEVAVLARELFLLPPRERAVRRNEWLLANASRHGELAQAVKPITRLRPDLVALDPQLFARLTGPFDANTFASAARAEPLYGVEPAETEITELPTPAIQAVRESRARQGEGGWSGSWIFIFGMIMLVRACASVTGPDSNSPNPVIIKLPERKYEIPNTRFDSPKLDSAAPVVFTHEQVAKFVTYERNNMTGFTPASYWDWVRSGRPGAGEAVVPKPRGGFGKEQ